MKVAVLTDSLSDDYVFPYWHAYYGEQFGSCNLFVQTYHGLRSKFTGFLLGGVIELPESYEDRLRARALSSLCSYLLTTYDVVIRVDTDEFLVVDSRRDLLLRDYVAHLQAPYVTARGFDVIQLPGESIIEQGAARLLAHRSVAYPNSALNKTAITRIPLGWSEGFHWANVYPHFDDLFLLHLKRIDIEWQMRWFDHMSSQIADNADVPNYIKEYYKPEREKIEKYHREVAQRPRIAGIDNWRRDQFNSDFLKSISLNPNSGLYSGKTSHELTLCELPVEWKSSI
ncbi:MAG: hypothetical protein J0H67_14125 [Rhodospirillales bacterium]|nr:hypothetical protein [Rhodospirillales bacterium]